MSKIGEVYCKTVARARGQVGGLTKYLIWSEIGPKVSDGEKPGWRDNQRRDNQVQLYIYMMLLIIYIIKSNIHIILSITYMIQLFIYTIQSITYKILSIIYMIQPVTCNSTLCKQSII